MKKMVQRILGLLGYEIKRKSSNLDAFAVQKELIKARDPVIFDVGANTGVVTKKYRDLFPLASIYSFEPFPRSFERLRENTANDPLVSVYELAMSDNKGVVVLNCNTSSDTNSLLATDPRGSSYWGERLLDTEGQLEVNATSIDSFCKDYAISEIDILKLDIQGSEFLALAGARKTLSSRSISLIYAEIILAPTYQAQHDLRDYLNLLDSFGYELVDLFDPVRKHMQLVQADFLFQRSAFQQEVQRTAM